MLLKLKQKKLIGEVFRDAAGMYPMPSFYLNKIDGAGYIEKYNFSFLPGSNELILMIKKTQRKVQKVL